MAQEADAYTPTDDDEDDDSAEIMDEKEHESRLQQLSSNALQARASIAQQLGTTAGATIDSVRYILEEILSYRLDTMRKNLIEHNKNDKYYKKELQQTIALLTKQVDIVKEDNSALKQQLLDHAAQRAMENNVNSKLNAITLQNLKTLAVLKQMQQRQIENEIDDDPENETNQHHENSDANLLKRLKLENVELKAQVKQCESHIKYLEQSKINTIMTMSQEIQKLRQQIIDLNKSQSTVR